MLACGTATSSAPSYFHSLMTIYISSRTLRSASERRLMVPSQRGTKSLSRTFSFTVPDRSHPNPEGWIPDNFQATLENSSLPSLLDFILKKTVLSFLNPALFPWIFSLSLSSHCLAGISSEQCLELCITSTPCVYLPLYNVSLIVFLNCNSLWIKASANWINVNVNE